MSNDPDTILLQTEEQMEKASEYLKHELKGNAAISYPPAGLQYQLSFVKTQ